MSKSQGGKFESLGGKLPPCPPHWMKPCVYDMVSFFRPKLIILQSVIILCFRNKFQQRVHDCTTGVVS